jgi:hypothetical protein
MKVAVLQKNACDTPHPLLLFAIPRLIFDRRMRKDIVQWPHLIFLR